AVLADGSEYRGRYSLGRAALREFHLPRLELLLSAGPDLLAVETIPDVEEAEVLVALLDELAGPAWLSYSIDGDRTRAGQPLHDALSVAAGCDAVFAVGVNCCDPRDVLGAVETAGEVTGKRVVVYPNSGELWDRRTRGWVGDPGYDVRLAPGWVAAGAHYVGGCCRVGPHDIARLSRTLAGG
ncbi:MAG: homocysteine S-methyltransferase family protein, partial [Nocardioidaceae bacterium]